MWDGDGDGEWTGWKVYGGARGVELYVQVAKRLEVVRGRVRSGPYTRSNARRASPLPTEIWTVHGPQALIRGRCPVRRLIAPVGRR